MEFIENIPLGAENAISRTELAIKCGIDDRTMRREIEKARQEYPIINLGNGYYRPTREEISDARNYYLQEYSRAMSILKSTKPLRRWIDRVTEC